MKLSAKHLLIGAALLGALVLFYFKTNRIVPAEHGRFDDSLHRLLQMDATLNQDVLKARSSLLEDYDSFPGQINDLKETVGDLTVIPSFVPEAGRQAIRQEVEELSHLITQKEGLLERFKSQNAVLGNSLQYFPVAGAELAKLAAADDHGRELESLLNGLMQQVLVYSLQSSESQIAEIRLSLDRLDEWRVRHGDHPQDAALAILAAHAESIVLRKPKVEALTRELVSIPIGQRIEETLRTYDGQFSKAVQAGDFYRIVLYLICALLVIVVGYTIFALDVANTHLEGRVNERTRDLLRKNGELQAEITERQRVQQRLAEKKQRLRSILESEPECVKLVAADGALLEMNPAGLKIVEADCQEAVLGRSVYELIAPEHHAAFRALNEAVFQGESRIAEFEIIGLKGTRRLMQTHACPLRDTAGAIVAQLAVTRDVTETRRVEAELAYERDLLHTLLKNSPDQIYFKDRESRFLKCSHALAERFGVCSTDDLVGKSDFDYFTKEHARPAFEDEQEIIRTGRAVLGKVEKEFWKDDCGKITWALTTKVPLRDKTGKIIGTFGISKDITAIKEAESKLEAVHSQLLQTSRQAGMAEVASSVLHNVGNVLNSVNISLGVASDKAAKLKIASLGRVVALLSDHADGLPQFFASHPQGMQLPTFLAQLAEHFATEQQTLLAELGSLRANFEHINEIVATQQNYAGMGGVIETLSLTEVIDDALRMNAATLTRHGARVVRELDSALPPVETDRHKVLLILTNLIRNAKYACDEASPADKCITVRTQLDGDGLAKISVSDNGIGIPQENLTRIFAHGFTTRKTGHGFGLHSSALAAREMGGSLRAHSAGPGHGATFTIELPLAAQKS